MVITESAIDALSYHAIRQLQQARYISIGGAMNPAQPALIKAAVCRLPPGGRLIIATDNDPGGDRLAAQIKAIAAGAQRPDMGYDE
jgi:precorrin-6B methylase 2